MKPDDFMSDDRLYEEAALRDHKKYLDLFHEWQMRTQEMIFATQDVLLLGNQARTILDDIVKLQQELLPISMSLVERDTAMYDDGKAAIRREYRDYKEPQRPRRKLPSTFTICYNNLPDPNKFDIPDGWMIIKIDDDNSKCVYYRFMRHHRRWIEIETPVYSTSEDYSDDAGTVQINPTEDSSGIEIDESKW
jgi:hypothetical protein